MDGITTAGGTTVTTTSVTVAGPQTIQSRASSPTPPIMIAPPPPAVSAEQRQEISTIKRHLNALPNVTDIVRLCDHAGLNTKGSLDDLINRYWRYEIRRRFRNVIVQWDPVDDERGQSLPLTLTSAVRAPEVDETLRTRLAQLDLDDSQALSATPPPTGQFREPTEPRQVQSDLPTGQSRGPYRDPITYEDIDDSILTQADLAPPHPPGTYPNAPVVSFAPQYVLPRAVTRPTLAPLPRSAPLLPIPPLQPQSRYQSEDTFSAPPAHNPRSNSTHLRPPTQTALRHPHSFQAPTTSFTARDIAGIDHFRRFGPKFAGRRHDDGEEYLLRLYEYCSSRSYSAEELLRILPESFTGDALMWYRVESSAWSNYEEFVLRFRARFGHSHLQDKLRREVELRTQGPGEPSGEYITKMRTYFNLLTPPP